MVCFALLGTVAFLHSKKRTKIATRNWTRKWTQQKGAAVFNNIVDSTAKILKRDNAARKRLCFVQSYYACWKLLFFHFFQFPLKVFEVINKYFNRHSRSSSICHCQSLHSVIKFALMLDESESEKIICL